MHPPLRRALIAQGLFYLATGLWPFVSLASFEWVTGPKTDDWLVHTVGLLLVAIAASLLTAAKTAEQTTAVAVAAIGAALALASIDVVYVSLGHIRGIYLVDAAIEVGFACWIFLALRSARAQRRISQ